MFIFIKFYIIGQIGFKIENVLNHIKTNMLMFKKHYFLFTSLLKSLYICDDSSSEFTELGGESLVTISPYDNDLYHLTYSSVSSTPFLFKKVNTYADRNESVAFEHVLIPGGYKMKVGSHYFCYDGSETPKVCTSKDEHSLWSAIKSFDGISICTSKPYQNFSFILTRDYCLTIDRNLNTPYLKNADSYPARITRKGPNNQNQQFSFSPKESI